MSIHSEYQSVIPNGEVRKEMKNCCSISSNSSIGEFLERFHYKANLMYGMRAFVHWYIQEGMEEGQLNESLEDLQNLIQEYE